MSGHRRDYQHGEVIRSVSLRHLTGDRYSVQVDDRSYEVAATRTPDGRVRFTLDGETFAAASAKLGKSLQVRVAGRTWQLAPAAGRGGTTTGGRGIVEAPMTGTIEKLLVQAGDPVERGATVAVLTAMKMEHKLTADIDGVVTELTAEVGVTVDQGTVLARIEPS